MPQFGHRGDGRWLSETPYLADVVWMQNAVAEYEPGTEFVRDLGSDQHAMSATDADVAADVQDARNERREAG